MMQSEFITDLENMGVLYNRMAEREKEAVKRKETLTRELEDRVRSEFTYQPAINEKSRDIA
jgi:hypothetical protein